jgi:hypothetical protein
MFIDYHQAIDYTQRTKSRLGREEVNLFGYTGIVQLFVELLLYISNPVVKGTQTNFKVTLDQNGGTAALIMISISKGDKQVCQASALAGHSNQPLHTAEGIVTIPDISTTRCLYNEHYSVRDSLQSNKT